MYCEKCGKAIASDAKFCAECGAVAPGNPSTASSRRRSSPSRFGHETTVRSARRLDGRWAVDPGCALGYFGGVGGGALAVLATIGTTLWAAVDSSRVRLREYKTKLAAHPAFLAIAMLLLWCIILPWYLVVRSKIRAGQMEKRERPRLGLSVLLIPVGCVALAAIVSAALFMSAGSSVKGIWQQTDSQVGAAAGSSAQPASALARSPMTVPATGSYKMNGTVHNVADNGQTVEQRRVGLLDVAEEAGGKVKFSLKAALVRDEASGDVEYRRVGGRCRYSERRGCLQLRSR